jgi:hypothetical protein
VRQEATPILCVEQDSMQGSHACTKQGTYVLQWRAHDYQTGVFVCLGFYAFFVKIVFIIIYR